MYQWPLSNRVQYRVDDAKLGKQAELRERVKPGDVVVKGRVQTGNLAILHDPLTDTSRAPRSDGSRGIKRVCDRGRVYLPDRLGVE